ncbi:DinB family protein [Rhodospirillaceae bacterium SYSU D60014]|uniref:DinB family protein n=1 Tax=Virgifigura deserti TaxID=2268457 RepID=UPI000E66AE31
MERSYFQRLARYNAWANRRLYDACGRLTRADYVAQRAAFFGSIHKTLNHLLVADRIWLGRFMGKSAGIDALDQILFDDFDALRAARIEEDERILTLVSGYSDSALQGVLAYRNVAGEAKTTPLVWALAHFFNHQTHHRGQAHAMLSGTPVPPPPLDLLYFLPEDAV